MFLIGQTLNSSDDHVRTAMASGDLPWLRDLASRQMEAGMATLDIHAGALAADEGELLGWLIPWLENLIGVGVCIDSANPELLLSLAAGRKHPPILNSLTLEHPWPEWLTEAVEGGLRLIVQMREGRWLPADCDERLAFADRVLERMDALALPPDGIFLDPVLLPWGDDLAAGAGLLRFLERFDALPTLVGLSNVSHGHDRRTAIRRRWFVELEACGLSAAIVDPFDPAWRPGVG